MTADQHPSASQQPPFPPVPPLHAMARWWSLVAVVAMALPPRASGPRSPATPGAQVQQALARAVSGGSSSFTLPAGEIVFGKAVFSLQAARNFALRGSPTGTTTLLFAPGGGMRVVGCTNVTVSSVTIDYDPAPFSQLVIDRVVSSAEGCCTPPGSGSAWCSTPPSACCNATYEVSLHPRSHTIAGFPTGLLDASHHTRSEVWTSQGVMTFPWGAAAEVGVTSCHAPWPASTEALGPLRFRLRMRPVRNASAGTILTYHGREYLTYVVANSTAVVTEHVQIHSATGFAIVELDGECGHAYRHVSVTRREGLMIASNADSFHSNDCARGPTIEHCEFAHMMDDYVNIHSTLFSVAGTSGQKIELAMNRGLPVVGGAARAALDMWETSHPLFLALELWMTVSPPVLAVAGGTAHQIQWPT